MIYVLLNKKTFYIFLLLVSAFIALSMGINSGAVHSFDVFVASHIQNYRSASITTLMIFITNIGSYKTEYPILFILIGLSFAVKRSFIYPTMLIINLMGVRLLNRILKDLFGRPRPTSEHLVHVGGFSFPSGHAMISIAFYGFITYLLFEHFKVKRQNISHNIQFVPILVLFGVLIFLIGLSRIYLGVHFPSDVIAGFVAGGIWLILSIGFLNSLNKMSK